MTNRINLKTEIKEKIKPILAKAKTDKDILAIALFGSSIKSNQYKDIDVCLFLKNNLSNLEISNIKLEYINLSDDDVDIQIFQQLPLYIRIRILKEGKIMLSNDENRLYELAFKTIKEFNLYEKLYDLCLKGVENG